MAEQPPQISLIDARLAEIDRRLGAIQSGLEAADPADLPVGSQTPEKPQPPEAPGAELPPRVDVDLVPDAVDPSQRADTLIAELRQLAAAHQRVLESTQELLAAYERALTSLRPQDAQPVREFSVSAGPFHSTEALRGFEQTLAKIPAVRDVAVRGYEGGDRAIVDVHLIDPTS
ncbi:MAG TPA: hypothetical protein VGH45_10905 [Solirubrobacteraceae bacterium]|jgi:hypothetical protein